jgi:hypothetical protein
VAVEFSNTPTSAVIIVCAMVAIIASATWKNAKGEGWGLVVFLLSLIVGFNLSVEFAVYFLEWIANTFASLSNMISDATEFGQGTGLLAVIVALAISVYIMRTIKFDSVRLAALGALYGILLRLLLDFLYWLATSGVIA